MNTQEKHERETESSRINMPLQIIIVGIDVSGHVIFYKCNCRGPCRLLMSFMMMTYYNILFLWMESHRSLLALDELHDDGYTNLAWLSGGFSSSRGNNFPDVQGSTKLQYANIGGAAEILLKFVLFMQSIINGVKGAIASKDNST